MVEVIQSDRDAAADILWRDGLHRRSCKVKDGHLDDNSIVLALAHHRQQAEAREEGLERALEGIVNMTQPRLAKEEASFEMRDAAVAALTAYRSARP